MRIVHVSSFYDPPSGSSTEALRQLAAGYKRAGHEFITIGPGHSRRRVETAHGTEITVPTLSRLDGRLSLVPVSFAVRDLLAELSPDRVELADRLTRRTVLQWAEQHNVPTVVFGAEQSGPSAAAAGATPTNRTRTTAIAPGVDLAEFSPLRWSQQARGEYSLGAEVLLVHVGGLARRAAPALSIGTLVELLKRGVNARLVLLGEGELPTRLARAASALPITVAGVVVDSRQLAVLLANADVALSPGRSTTSMSGLAALEPLAAGTPVVATVGSDAATFLRAVSGETTASTARAVADGVQRVLMRRVEERRTEARAQAARFPWRDTISSLLDLHEFPGLLEPDYEPAL
jgi:alpha-1,6-mannosyltransferase